jgi:putative restriction endonuclease
MKLYVGITDADWFRYLRQRNAEEMNFWRPRATTQFKILEASELFLFKSKYPENKIVGGAFFVRHSTLSLDLAWKAFGEANGMPSLTLFRQKIGNLRRDQEFNPIIGCTILTQPFYLEEAMYIEPPRDWPSNIVTGKSFEILPGSEGLRLFEQAQPFFSQVAQSDHEHSGPVGGRYGKDLTIRPRLGQGGFVSWFWMNTLVDVPLQARRRYPFSRLRISSLILKMGRTRYRTGFLCDLICIRYLTMAI